MARAPDLPEADVRVASGYGAADEMRTALEGARTLLLVPAEESRDRVRQHATALDAAVAAGVERVVYIFFAGARPDSTFTLARDHAATEAHVRASGLPLTFLRMNLYLDFIPQMADAEGVIRGPAGDGRFAGVLRYLAIATGELAAIGDGVRRLTGHEPGTLEEHLRG